MALKVVSIDELKEIEKTKEEDAIMNLTVKPLYSGVLLFRSYSRLNTLFKQFHNFFHIFKDISVQVNKNINIEVSELTSIDIIKGALDLTKGDVIYLYDNTEPTPGKK